MFYLMKRFFPYSTDAIASSLKPNPSDFKYNLLQSYTIFVSNSNLNNLEADAAVHGSFSPIPSSTYSHNTSLVPSSSDLQTQSISQNSHSSH